MDAKSTKPAPASERAISIDAIRGLAILGILPVNIQYFGMGVDHTAIDPSAMDNWMRTLVHIFFESKFIGLFSLLFGAGIIMMDRSCQRKGVTGTGVFLRRNSILLAMGFVHAYLLWYGDILFTYAVIGFGVFWLRRLGWRWLMLIGGAIFVFGWIVTSWLVILEGDSSSPYSYAEEIALGQGGFVDRIGAYAILAAYYQTLIMLLFSSWFNTGLMLMGMALAKLGFFTGQLPTRLYLGIIAFGATIALPMIALSTSTIPEGASMSIYYSYANLLLAPILGVGYASVLILLCTRLKWTALVAPFAAAGRMALTNYLMQSVLCAFIFYGGLGGLGLIGEYNDAGVHLIGAGIIGAQLIIGPLWLMAFRFGPMEWLWRSMTYLKLQPMRRTTA